MKNFLFVTSLAFMLITILLLGVIGSLSIKYDQQKDAYDQLQESDTQRIHNLMDENMISNDEEIRMAHELWDQDKQLAAAKRRIKELEACN
jgi:hypothetical protein